MIQHRDLTKTRSGRSSPDVSWFLRALAFVVVPVLRLIARVVPPFGRAMRHSAGGLMGTVSRSRDRGDHPAAYAAALEGLDLHRRAAEKKRHAGKPADFEDFHWWRFLDLAATEAGHLGPEERAKVLEFFAAAPGPGGMFAAKCLTSMARWRWTAGDVDGAVNNVRRAILADASWPYAHILLGWYGLVSGRFDPLPELREALRVDAGCAASIVTNAEFANAQGLLEALGLERAANEPTPK